MGGIREGAEGGTCGVGEGDFPKQAVAHLVCTEEDEKREEQREEAKWDPSGEV